MYVSDAGGNTINKVSPTGTVTPLVSSGLSNPRGIFVTSNGDIYVADYINDVVKKYSSSNSYSPSVSLSGTGSGNIFRPTGIYVTSNGDVYVANNAAASGTNSKVGVLLYSGGSYTYSEILQGSFTNPVALQVFNNDLYVSDEGAKKIYKVSNPLSSPSLSTVLDMGVMAGTPFPEGMHITSAGDIYFTTTQPGGACKLWKLSQGDTTPTLLQDSSQFSTSVHEVFVTSDNTVYVCDNGNSKIKIITNGGTGTVSAFTVGISPQGIYYLESC